MSIALGIDTGGTYTDAVLVEYETNHVLAHAKALTTKHNLSIGVRNAMQCVLAGREVDVRLVSLSTTLATNSIVEGHGAPICTLLIGYQGRMEAGIDLQRELGTPRFAFIAGGHVSTGEEWEALDLRAAAAAIVEHAPHVSAFAVSGFFGTRNPSHELAVKKLVSDLSGLPVTCGHELTHRLDAVRRATTVSLNARLIPLLCDLMNAVESSMGEWGIKAPLMVVKGDGSLMESSMARERPIETILSGPAASVVGAQHLAGGDDVVVVDMGGTTTDIAVLTDGRPRLNPQGASVGRWRTMVEAIDVHTVGLGGDSRVWFDEGRELHVGPRRVVPLCLLAAENPDVLETLQRQVARPYNRHDVPGEFFLLQRDCLPADGEHPSFEPALFALLRRGPADLDQVNRVLQYPRLYHAYLDGLERQGILIRAGLTPTDAAHVLGFYSDWSQEAAVLGAQLLARRLGISGEELCHRILRQTSAGIAREVIVKLLSDDGIALSQTNGHLDSYLIERALRPEPNASLAFTFMTRPSVVAIGAPVRTYFPTVGEMLHGNVRIPDHMDVANAVGAVVGSVVFKVHVSVLPQAEDEGIHVHLPEEMQPFRDLPTALRYAEERGCALAQEGARRAGAEDIRVRVERHDQTAPVAAGWGDDLYLGTQLEVFAVGRPRLAIR
ncbi:MAG: hydantoinase/oxoprolinase family protein [Anaerolineae bacterium]